MKTEQLIVFDDKKLEEIEHKALHLTGLADILNVIANNEQLDWNLRNALYSMGTSIDEVGEEIANNLGDGWWGAVEDSENIMKKSEHGRGNSLVFSIGNIRTLDR